MSLSDSDSSESELEPVLSVTPSVRVKEETLHVSAINRAMIDTDVLPQIIVASPDKEHNERLTEMIKTLGHHSLVVETGEHLIDTLQSQTFAALFLVSAIHPMQPYDSQLLGFEPRRGVTVP